jgi:hypothetical protein
MNPMNGATVNLFAGVNKFTSLRDSRKQRFFGLGAPTSCPITAAAVTKMGLH